MVSQYDRFCFCKIKGDRNECVIQRGDSTRRLTRDVGRKSSLIRSELFLIGGVEAAKENGDTEIGKWMAADSRGRNVSVTTMSSGDEDAQMPHGVYNISIWNLDSTTYALLVSSFDEYNTTQIIKTLTVS